MWAKTILLITCDENDGFFDHLVPPHANSPVIPGASTVPTDREFYDGQHGPGSYGLVPRVPMFVVSPWSTGSRPARPDAVRPRRARGGDGRDGFFRRSSGSTSTDRVKVRVTRVGHTQRLSVAVDAPRGAAVSVANAYGGRTKVGARPVVVDTSATGGWYDLTVVADGTPFLRSFAGHLETGHPPSASRRWVAPAADAPPGRMPSRRAAGSTDPGARRVRVRGPARRDAPGRRGAGRATPLRHTVWAASSAAKGL